MGLSAARGPRRLVEGGRCMDYSFPVSVKRECGGVEVGRERDEVPGC